MLQSTARWQTAYLGVEGQEGPVAVLGRKVIDLAPLVVIDRHLDRLELLRKVEVEESKAAESHVRGRLYHGRCGGKEQRVAVFAVTRAILLARDDALTPFAVPDENLRSRTYHVTWEEKR